MLEIRDLDAVRMRKNREIAKSQFPTGAPPLSHCEGSNQPPSYSCRKEYPGAGGCYISEGMVSIRGNQLEVG